MEEEEKKGDDEPFNLSPPDDESIREHWEQIKRLGINTYSMVLLWAGFKSLAKLCYRIAKDSPSTVNYVKPEPAKEATLNKILKE